MLAKRWMRTALVLAVLQIGSLTGVLMRPEDIEELSRAARQTKIEQTLKEDNEKEDGEPVR